jgi:hypothetical protein
MLAGLAISGVGASATLADASPPLVATAGVEAIGTTTARISGSADPQGEATALHADFSTVGGEWCETEGAQGTPSETAPVDLGSGSAMISEVSVTLEGLIPGTKYCARLLARNGSGTSASQQVEFTTLADASPPLVATAGGPQLGSSSSTGGGVAPLPSIASIPISAAASASTIAPKRLTQHEKLARALQICMRRARSRRARCEQVARRRYGLGKRAGSQARKGKR